MLYYQPSSRRRKQQLEAAEPTRSKNHRPSRRPQQGTKRPTLPYTSILHQACLIGLSQGLPLEPRCPNVTYHQRGKSLPAYHLISKEKFSILDKDQLAHNLDENCQCLDKKGMYGAVGVLLKLVLTDYGVAKGVQLVDENRLRNETNIYAHLSKLQGAAIPAHLGLIELVRPYPLGGDSLHSAMPIFGVDIAAEELRSRNEVVTAGVVHWDMHNANLLWNAERNVL
ncbi:hypothetical protein AJ79_05828 [Helicocarpus griseus UAMH5409]|uniref:Aminoglycoside phosphotransferase domain-containing protein n=1 Tax=Helicocarpus griseus UAMH5409 TaxID=1447875 RepID=A0A2B7XAZ8_9EURO|nr:hypothetical protein AJ79_05828 [Helicocarpus griseus UAMH5409]